MSKVKEKKVTLNPEPLNPSLKLCIPYLYYCLSFSLFGSGLSRLGITIPALLLRRFWMMLAHTHGQLWNASQISKSLGISAPTVRHYLDILVDTYIIRQLQPYYINIKKEFFPFLIEFLDLLFNEIQRQVDGLVVLRHTLFNYCFSKFRSLGSFLQAR